MKRTTLVLSDSDYNQLHSFIKTGKKSGKELERAYILMALHKQKSYKDVEEYYYVNRTTIWRTACNYREHGLDYALTDNARPGQPRKYSDKQEAEVIALACSESPQGRKRWTIRLLTEQLQKNMGMKTINRESVRLILKKTNLSLG